MFFEYLPSGGEPPTSPEYSAEWKRLQAALEGAESVRDAIRNGRDGASYRLDTHRRGLNETLQAELGARARSWDAAFRGADEECDSLRSQIAAIAAYPDDN